MEQNGLELPLYNAPTADANRGAMQHGPATDRRSSWWQKCKPRLDLTWSSFGHFTRPWWTGAMNDETRARVGRSKMQGVLKQPKALA